MKTLAGTLWAQLPRDLLQSLLDDLIRAGGENPPGDECAGAAVGVSWLEKLGYREIEVHEPSPARRSVTAVYCGPGGPGRRLLFNGHLDVVPTGDPAHWTYPPLELTVRDGKAFGRGVADMKGAMSAFLLVPHMLAAAGVKWRGRFQVQLAADEEALMVWGTKYLAERVGFVADAAIIGEPTHLRVAVAEKGLVHFRLLIKGKSAHAARPDLGVNAIERGAKAVLAIQGIKSEATHPILGSGSVSTGLIRGGTSCNTVPGQCEIEVDRRLVPGEDLRVAEAGMRRAITEAIGAEGWELGVVYQIDPAEVPADCEVALLARRVVKEVLPLLMGADEGPTAGLDEPTGLQGCTDAVFLINQAQIPTVLWGPGGLEVAHTVDESVPLVELERAAVLYACFASRFLA